MATLSEIRERMRLSEIATKQHSKQSIEQRQKEREQEEIVRLLKGQYVDRTKHVQLDPNLICPRCQGDNLHHVSVELFNRSEDSEQGDHFTIVVPESYGWLDEFGAGYPLAKSTVDSNMTRNPSSRRTGVIVNFTCEECGPGLSLNIAQHKGVSDAFWSFKQYQEHNK